MAARPHRSALRKNTPTSNSERPDTYATASVISGCTPNIVAAVHAAQASNRPGSRQSMFPPLTRTRVSESALRMKA